MKTYIVLLQDRHSDPDCEVYSDHERAIARARELARKYCRFPDDYDEKEYPGYGLVITYSCESDSVTVLERTIDQQAP